MSVDLDELDLARLDPAGMLASVEATPEQWRHAVQLAEPLVSEGALAAQPPTAAVVAGMGGSGIAGDVAVTLADAAGTLPVVASKGYRLPAWVGPRTVVVAVSYSGNTEETLTAVEQARDAGATIVAVTSGGALGNQAADGRWPLVRVPPGRQPRASLGYLAAPTVAALVGAGVLRWNLLADLQAAAEHTSRLVAGWHHAIPAHLNPAKAAAQRLHGLVPVFHGGRGIGSLVALRARCQVNENASRPAVSGELPELDHNEVVGWDAPAEVTERFGLMRVLDPNEEHPQVHHRFAATLAVAGGAFGAVVDHHLTGASRFERLAGGILFVDLVSVYLALLEGVDPTPVAPIDELKLRVAAAADAAADSVADDPGDGRG